MYAIRSYYAFLPLYFITGMMGPYMAPMAAGVPLTVTFSTLAALTIVPWLAYSLLKNRPLGAAPEGQGGVHPAVRRLYERMTAPFLDDARKRRLLWLSILGLLLVAVALPALRLVPLKMLPFDNKNELQLVIDMDEGTPLEATDRAVRDFEAFLLV